MTTEPVTARVLELETALRELAEADQAKAHALAHLHDPATRQDSEAYRAGFDALSSANDRVHQALTNLRALAAVLAPASPTPAPVTGNWILEVFKALPEAEAQVVRDYVTASPEGAR